MIALDRQGWILVGFGVLFFTALVVSACGWLLLWRSRGQPIAAEPKLPGREHSEAEPPAESTETAALPPANPLR